MQTVIKYLLNCSSVQHRQVDLMPRSGPSWLSPAQLGLGVVWQNHLLGFDQLIYSSHKLLELSSVYFFILLNHFYLPLFFGFRSQRLQAFLCIFVEIIRTIIFSGSAPEPQGHFGEIRGYSVYHLLGGGWWVVGGVLFFVHTPVQTSPYTRVKRGQASLRSELRQITNTKLKL